MGKQNAPEAKPSDLAAHKRTDAPGRDTAATSVTDERQQAPGYVPEAELTNEEVVRRRTSGDDWPLDGRYRRVFTIAVPRVSVPDNVLALDWNDGQHEAMHEANKVAVLQEALNKGLHPRSAATFDGQQGPTDERAGSASLIYSVEVVPAAVEGPDAAKAFTPSAALAEQGGSTLPEATSAEDKRR